MANENVFCSGPLITDAKLVQIQIVVPLRRAGKKKREKKKRAPLLGLAKSIYYFDSSIDFIADSVHSLPSWF